MIFKTENKPKKPPKKQKTNKQKKPPKNQPPWKRIREFPKKPYKGTCISNFSTDHHYYFSFPFTACILKIDIWDYGAKTLATICNGTEQVYHQCYEISPLSGNYFSLFIFFISV